MSKWPWPLRLKRIVLRSPASRQRRASSMATRMACALSGAGMIPSARANCTAAAGGGPRPDSKEAVLAPGGKRFAEEREGEAREVRAAADAADDDVGVLPGLRH